MIIVDTALQKREHDNNPIRAAMVGAGFMGRGIALQIETAAPGIRLVAISNRHIDGARRAYAEAGVADVREVETVAELEDAVASGDYAVTSDPTLLCDAEGIMAHLTNKLGIKPGETTSDNKYTLLEVECLGSCGTSPVVQINEDYYEELTPEKLDTVLDSLE